MRMTTSIASLVIAGVLAGCAGSHPGTAASSRSAPTGRAPSSPIASRPASTAGVSPPAHIVLVVLENHGFGEVLGNAGAPFLNGLAVRGVTFTQFYAISHPSEPNYLALFSGSTQGVFGDACPVRYAGANLASSLRAVGRTFVGYAEDLPRPGFAGCSSGEYARKHAPWIDFSNVPTSVSQPMSSFPSDYAALPVVSWVIPNVQHDMHDGTVAQADSWLRRHLSGYASWARLHHSLLIVTADEDDGTGGNRIPLIIEGSGVKPGRDGRHRNLYSLLRLIEDMYRLPRLAHSAHVAPITGIA